MSTTPRRRNAALTRTEVLDRAMETAADLGASGFTIDAVAARTAVSKGAVLHHFSSKTALLEAMIDEAGRQFTEAVRREAEKDPESYCRNARAYLRATVNEVSSPAEVSLGRAILAACAMDRSLGDRWRDWAMPLFDGDSQDPAEADDGLMLKLIADGLWLSDMMGTYTISPEQRKALLSLLTPGPLNTGAAQ